MIGSHEMEEMRELEKQIYNKRHRLDSEKAICYLFRMCVPSAKPTEPNTSHRCPVCEV